MAKGKGKKSSRGGSSSRSTLPPGWVEGDWIQFTIELDDLQDLVEGGLIEHDSWRLPGEETEPRPREDLYKGNDEETGDAATSTTAPPNVINLPDDDEEMHQCQSKIRTSSRRLPAGKKPQTASVPELSTQQSGDLHRASVMFADPASAMPTVQASGSTVQVHALDPQAAATDSPIPLFATHRAPEDPASAAKEAIHQAGLMMEQMKVDMRSCELGARYTDQEKKQIRLDLDQKHAQENLQKAKAEANGMAEKMREALEKKDRDLAEAQKAAQEKTTLAEKKLASVDKLEEENAKLKTALDEANKESTHFKKDKEALTDKASDLVRRRNELETYLGGLAQKLSLMLEEFCQNFEEETGRIEMKLDPINSPIKDEAAMNVFRLESRLASVTDYIARLKVAVSRVDTTLWPGATLQNDLESLMARLNQIPGRVLE
nr:CAP-Gly domain-containing linker protein 1-like [Aegilops tauschii subsp. strangulata]